MFPNAEETPRLASWLSDVIATKKKRNPAYSLRALARQLGVSAAYLSQVANGKKPLSAATAERLAALLDLDKATARRLIERAALESVRAAKGGARKPRANAEYKFENLTLERFRVLADWYHIALLDLLTLHGAKADPAWLARSLGIAPHEARAALERLERLGLLERQGKTLRKTTLQLSFPTDKSDPSVRRFHAQMIQQALAALERQGPGEYESREISGMTLAINPERMPEARRRIHKFRKDLYAFLSEGPCTALYQFNTQLFRLTPKPLTKRRGKGA